MSKTPIPLLASLLLFSSLSVAAEGTRYISDELLVPLRKSPCDNCSIVHQGLVAGTKLTLHEAQDGWAKVTTGQGQTGWLPSQYLVNKPIAKERLNAAEANTRVLAEENADHKNKLSTIAEELAVLKDQHSQLLQRNGELETELATIKKVSGNALVMQEQNEELIKQNRILQSEVDVLTATKDQLADDNSQKWFMYGGIAVFLGAILAILLPRLHRRRKYTEWG
jgi:SH3 domain protein